MQQTPTPSAKGPLKRYREEETPSMSHSPDSTTGGSAKKKRHRLKKKEAKEAQTNKPQQKPPNSVATASRLATPNVDEDDGDTSDESSSPASLQMFVDYEREQAVKKAGPKPVEVSVRTDKGKQKETLKELSTEDSDDDDFYVPSPEEVERVNLSKRDYRDRKHASGWFIPDKDEAAQIFYDSHMGPYWSLSRKDFVGETKITIQAQTAQQNARNKELKAFVHILGYEPLVKRREIVEQAVNNLLPAAVGKYRLSIIQKQSVWGLLEFDEEEHAKFFQTTLVALNKSSYCGVAFKELRNAPYKQRLIKAKSRAPF